MLAKTAIKDKKSLRTDLVFLVLPYGILLIDINEVKIYNIGNETFLNSSVTFVKLIHFANVLYLQRTGIYPKDTFSIVKLKKSGNETSQSHQTHAICCEVLFGLLNKRNILTYPYKFRQLLLVAQCLIAIDLENTDGCLRQIKDFLESRFSYLMLITLDSHPSSHFSCLVASDETLFVKEIATNKVVKDMQRLFQNDISYQLSENICKHVLKFICSEASFIRSYCCATVNDETFDKSIATIIRSRQYRSNMERMSLAASRKEDLAKFLPSIFVNCLAIGLRVTLTDFKQNWPVSIPATSKSLFTTFDFIDIFLLQLLAFRYIASRSDRSVTDLVLEMETLENVGSTLFSAQENKKMLL
ncbi:uncharacterized protein LOC130644988 isoform X2 [Hydractinia symbiolongicarpus]|uniref:uncharacterized protein LOC130644988 isoform X2 n=1 Tax=Hydractinia symbiolongicarpus TaxID=13093 RepID=UPI00254A8174|nr:uncharacterized protein LOC130644988 isoform X2 [Hydractinia symbiolongicarpus]